jgi:putative Holliday junction resolvase
LRFLGLDIGDRKIGIAVSDELGWIAQGVETYFRRNIEEDIKYLSQVISRYKPEKIVIGLPINMNGTLGPQAEKVKEFSSKLQEKLQQQIIFWDERLTTVAAEKTLIQADMSRKKRKKKVDMLAAIFILQSYLDANSKRNGVF